MNYKVTLTTQAAEQIRQIGFYIAHSLQEPQIASHWINLLYQEISKLHFMPLRHPLTEDEPWHTKGIHKMTVHNFLVYYLVDEENMLVSVTAVIYGRRDQITALTDIL